MNKVLNTADWNPMRPPSWRDVETPPAALSVAGVTQYIQSLLEQDSQLHHLWMTGEVSSTNERNGHLFFTLKEPDNSAAIQAVVWRTQRSQLAVSPAVGAQVFLLGRIRVYPQRGQYQVNAFQILPAGAGLQALRRQRLEQRLMAEGLFDEARKQPLPPYPEWIAVVTSPQAAAWGDIQRTLQAYQPGLKVLLASAIVQGDQAPTAIAAAIDAVVRDGRAEVVVIARGGGAREDLDCFDHEQVVRAIAACPMPVITGIGHERDQTLADLAADYAAHTPTAAAEQVTPKLEDLWIAHQNRQRAAHNAFRTAVQMHYEQIAELRRRLEQRRIEQTIVEERQHLRGLRERLQRSVQQRLQIAMQHQQSLQQTLIALDPASILQRGYAIVRAENDRVMTAAAGAQVGSKIQVELAQGRIVARVVAVERS